MKIWKPLTKKEERFNKKNPKHKISPYIAFHINEKIYRREAYLWKALGFEGLKQAYIELNEKGA